MVRSEQSQDMTCVHGVTYVEYAQSLIMIIEMTILRTDFGGVNILHVRVSTMADICDTSGEVLDMQTSWACFTEYLDGVRTLKEL